MSSPEIVFLRCWANRLYPAPRCDGFTLLRMNTYINILCRLEKLERN